MNNFTLKLIAIITMLADHIGAVLFPQYMWIRVIGRISFPIFCFLIIEGFYHTRNVYRYMTRLGIFALVSDIPFDLAFYNKPFNFEHQNVFFTLFLGLVVVHLMHYVEQKYQSNSYISGGINLAIAIAGCYLAVLLKTDYDFIGILLILSFYLFRTNKFYLLVATIVITSMQGYPLFFHIPIELYASFSLIPIFLYNGKKGPSLKYVFYLFYPVHLMCLYFIAHYLYW